MIAFTLSRRVLSLAESRRQNARPWAGLISVRVRPTWIRYSNYSVHPPEIVEFSVQQLV